MRLNVTANEALALPHCDVVSLDWDEYTDADSPPDVPPSGAR